MAPQIGGRGGDNADKYKNATNVKELLDMIGENVYKEKVKTEAQTYKGELEGSLSLASIFGVETGGTNETCDLVQKYYKHPNGGDKGKRYPCTELSGIYVERFSNTLGGQCTDSKIEGNINNCGACAPYRRLHLCHHNLESISDYDSNARHKLLLEVCMAAKYEGESLTRYNPIYQTIYKDYGSTMCTELARSFADIGDIIRGRDPFYGNTHESKQREKLEENLQKIFKQIHDKLNDSIKSKYNDDAKKNYYKLREDWWTANRETVWKALTCDARNNAEYFRQKACAGKTPTDDKCRCKGDQVPTYFDYVPQYLRWFEEWAEDFCRLRKRKLENAIKNCRNDEEQRYCSGNGYNCKETIRAENKLVEGDDCHKCSVACKPFVEWLDNQQKEFEKQKNKYTQEMEKYANGASNGTTTTTKQTSNGPINNLYVKEFYEQLQSGYGDVNAFLELLSKETACQKHPKVEVKGRKADHVDFKKHEANETFCRTEYCKPCPLCGLKLKIPPWEAIDESKCTIGKIKTFDENNSTPINLIVKDVTGTSIVDKLGGLCNDPSNKNIQKWKCYYQKGDKKEVIPRSNDCVLQDGNQHKLQERTIHSFKSLFWHWITEMLKDSIDWSKELDKCINNENATKCIKWCKTPCECYKKWVKRMKEEWGDIKKHFHKEKNLPDNRHFTTLEIYLEQEFLPSIEEAYGNDEAIENIEELLEERRTHADSELNNKEKKDIIDYLLEHEGKDAEKCTTTHNDNECPEERKQYINPCSEHVNKPTASVKDIARKMKSNARRQLGISGRKALKGDASQGKYKCNVKASDFKNNLCGITQKHSNAIGASNNPYNGKGNGKDQRFKIETQWKDAMEKNKEIKLYLPPRREHMCTSNLEHLNTGNNGLSNSSIASNSLLGYVLLAAKEEADYIKNNYKDTNDNKGICRAIRYSFADIGDIIRGRDLWDDKDQAQLQGHLKTIFGKIKENIDDDDIKDKYKESEPYKQLREDWWEANRYQVWNAMKCATKNSKIPCHGMPVEDYIPQRLRWMTEWAEWFCKEQYSLYDELEEKCMQCKKDDGKNCWKGKSECNKCDKQCKEYGKNIKTWKDQWEKLSDKYLTLYLYAQNDARNPGPTAIGDANDQRMIAFFKELQEANGDNELFVTTSPYFTAEGYIHQEMGPNVGCQKQTKFCNGGDNYAFSSKPKEYATACTCKDRDKPPPPPPPAPVVDVCKIVDDLFKDVTTLTNACPTKYGKTAPTSWKCIPTSGDEKATSDKGSEPKSRTTRSTPETATGGPAADGGKDGATGGLCIPPRRRKLYIDKIKKWAEKQTQQHTAASNSTLPTPAGTPSRAQDPLLAAFVESAAVETFFLWHKYKEEKKREKKEKEEAETGLVQRETSADTEQNKLKKGNIPDDFLRQMFYTLGDYRDICVGVKDNDVINALKSDGIDMQKIQEKIEQILPTSGNKETGVSPLPKPGGQPITREKWWNQNAKHIWEGMICALTYKDSGGKEQAPTQIDGAQNLFQQLKTQYGDYKNVKLDDTSGAKPKPTEDTSSHSGDDPINTPKLKDFVKLPPFFRWLHEWGNEFCVKRTEMLGKIRGECTDGGGSYTDRYCGGDGFDCTEKPPSEDNTFSGFQCPSCGKSCGLYKTWIEKKKTEYENQQKAYEQQKTKCQSKSEGGDNGFCKTLQENAAEFLQKLGSCSKTDNDNGKGKIDFKDTNETFGHAKDCDPCPIFGVKCINGVCNGGHTKGRCNGKTTITANDIGNGVDSTVLDMHVSDKSATTFPDGLQDACGSANIFKGIRKEQWLCRKFCGYDVCTLKNGNGVTDAKKYIQIRTLFKSWVENFLKDFNKINAKISHCTKNGEQIICTNRCVKKWVEKKTEEWPRIRDRYLKPYQNADGNDMKSLVRTFLEGLQSQIDATIKKAIQPCKIISNFESKQCNDTANSQNGNDNDLVLCLLDKLGERATSCQTQQENSDEQPNCADNSPSLDEEPLEEENPENKIGQRPSFCPQTPAQQEETDGTCDAVAPSKDEKPKGEQESSGPTGPPEPEPEPEQELEPEPESPQEQTPPSRPQPQPPQPDLSPLTTALVTSTLAWSVGIGFATFTYFYLKVNGNLINDSLNSNNVDIYDEVLKRKENELFGTKHPKHTNTHNVAKNTNNDPIDNQLDLFHTWLDRHRDMCEKWNNKEELLDKLKEEWNKDNDRANVPNDNKTLNTNVSIQIDMDHGKPKKEFTNMDTNMDTPTMH
ncbi:hypothetical protein PFTANZ_06380, partial [Plasmodium falciparum Tanzania (2000708)]